MTRLVFVHGRAQQGKNRDELLRLWVDAPAEGLGAPIVPPFVGTATMPYYGDALADWVTRESPELVTYGGAAADGGAPGEGARGQEFSAFAEGLIREMGTDYPLAYQEVAAELPDGEVVPKGPANWARVQATPAALDRKVPAAGRTALCFVADVEAYLKAPHVGRDIRQIVSEPLRQAVTEA
jgi:hypothetical protein